jgi:hypothetical protein
MRRTTLVVILFILAAGIIVGISQFLQSQPPVEFTVVINPLAEDWLREAITRFNDTNPVVNATQRIQFKIEVIDDVSIWQGSTGYTPEKHPAVWIPAASASVTYADRFAALRPSLACTPLVWGGYTSRVELVAGSEGGLFDWNAVQTAASRESWSALGGPATWGFVKLAFPKADTTMSGLGVLFAAAADFADSGDLTGGATRSSAFRSWLEPVIASVPNYQTLGNDPAAAMARGPSTAEIALLPENQWLKNLRGLTDDANDSFVFSYPAYQFALDFPLAVWNSQPTELEQQAAEALAQWLTQPAQVARTTAYGLRPAGCTLAADSSAALFEAGAPYGIQLAPNLGVTVQPPARSEASALIQWFNNVRR